MITLSAWLSLELSVARSSVTPMSTSVLFEVTTCVLHLCITYLDLALAKKYVCMCVGKDRMGPIEELPRY